MSELTAPAFTEHSGEDGSTVLDQQQLEGVLRDFRDWLGQLVTPATDVAGAAALSNPLDLSTLFGQMIALKHEVHLQTRAVRSQQDQNQEMLQKVSAALDELDREEPNHEEELKPVLKTLIDLYDVLSLAQREAARVRDELLPDLNELESVKEPKFDVPQFPVGKPSFWDKLFGFKAPEAPDVDEWTRQISEKVSQAFRQQREEQNERMQRVQNLLTSMVTGYEMGLRRVEHALERHELQPIVTENEPFDPELMEVLEVVRDSGRPDNEVVDEVRRGYRWNGKVLRPAQVRVAKS